MWGFCHECFWEKVKEIIRKEKFYPAGCTKEERDQRISTVFFLRDQRIVPHRARRQDKNSWITFIRAQFTIFS